MWEPRYRISFLEKLQMVMEPRRFGRILEIPTESFDFKLIQTYPSVNIIAKVPGSMDQIYTVILDIEQGIIFHDCPDYQKEPRICKHIGSLMKELPYQTQDLLIDWISKGTDFEWTTENRTQIGREIEHYLNGPIVSDLGYLISVNREVSENISYNYVQEIILKAIQINPMRFFYALETIPTVYPIVEKFFDWFPYNTRELFCLYMENRGDFTQIPITKQFLELYFDYFQYTLQYFSVETKFGDLILL
jgi:hypothetical protein